LLILSARIRQVISMSSWPVMNTRMSPGTLLDVDFDDLFDCSIDIVFHCLLGKVDIDPESTPWDVEDRCSIEERSELFSIHGLQRSQ
jgi:hypothetical protein